MFMKWMKDWGKALSTTSIPESKYLNSCVEAHTARPRDVDHLLCQLCIRSTPITTTSSVLYITLVRISDHLLHFFFSPSRRVLAFVRE